MKVVVRWKNDVLVDASNFNFSILYVVCLAFHCWCPAVVSLLLSSRVSLLVINLSSKQ